MANHVMQCAFKCAILPSENLKNDLAGRLIKIVLLVRLTSKILLGAKLQGSNTKMQIFEHDLEVKIEEGVEEGV